MTGIGIREGRAQHRQASLKALHSYQRAFDPALYEAWRQRHPTSPTISTVLKRLGEWPTRSRLRAMLRTEAAATRKRAALEAVEAYEREFTLEGYRDFQGLHPEQAPLQAIRRDFDNWPDARRAVGLSRGPGHDPTGTERDVVVALRAGAEELGGTVRVREYERLASLRGWPSPSIVRRIFGSMGKACAGAGVPMSRVGVVIAGPELEAQLREVADVIYRDRRAHAKNNGGIVAQGTPTMREYSEVRRRYLDDRRKPQLESPNRIAAAYGGSWPRALRAAEVKPL